MRLDGPIQASNIQRFIAQPGLSPNCLFVKVGCHMPNECHPCEENTDGNLEIVNNGDSGECGIVYQIKGDNYLLWSGQLNNGEGIQIGLIIHFPTDDFPESEIVKVKFFTGYIVDENTMVITDQVEYDIFVYVKKVNWTQMAVIGGVAIGSLGIIYSVISLRRKPISTKGY